MSDNKKAIIIGAGPAGIQSALNLAESGFDVSIIDEQIGGNYAVAGSLISNALIYLSYLYSSYMNKTTKFLDHVCEDNSFNFKKAKKYVESVSAKLKKNYSDDLENSGVNYIKGTARFNSENSVIVSEEENEYELEFDYAVVATGSRGMSNELSSSGKLITIRDIFELEKIPSSIAVIGGGFVGAEFSAFFKRLGSDVIIVEKSNRLLNSFDAQISKKYEDSLKKQSVEVIKDAEVDKVEKIGNKCITFLKDGNKIESEEVFVAIGRKPSLDNLDIEKAGVKLDKTGKPRLNTKLRSSNEAVYFVGDCTGLGMLVNWAYRSADIATNSITATGKVFQRHVLPRVLYIDPEIAYVGFNEDDAKEKGFDIGVIKYNFSDIEKSIILGESKGFLKVIYNKKNKRILGCHVIGKGAAQIVSMFSVMIQSKVSIDSISDYVFNHPTFAEVLSDIASKVK